MNNHKLFAPFLTPLISLIAGILLQNHCNLPILLHTLCITGSLILLVALRNSRKIIIKIPLCSLFLCAGGLLLQLQKNNYHELNKKFAHKNLDLIAKVTGKELLNTPTNRRGQAIELTVEQAKNCLDPAYHDASFKILCYTRFPIPITIADTIELSNIVINTKQTTNLSGNPSYSDYLVKEGVLATIFMSHATNYSLIKRPEHSRSRWFWNKRNTIYHELKKKLSPLTFSYFALIFLGNKQQNSIDQLRKNFNYWGLAHYLARSGLHIVLFIFIWQFFLGLFPIHIRFKRIALILICLVYNFLSWSSVPFARAYYVFLSVEAGRTMHCQTNFLHLLTLCCLSILLFNPMQLFFLDFQLTFALTFTLVLFSHLTQSKESEA
jgi:competence protein ComEC